MYVLLNGNNYYYNCNTEADWARDDTVPREQVPLCVCVVCESSLVRPPALRCTWAGFWRGTDAVWNRAALHVDP